MFLYSHPRLYRLYLYLVYGKYLNERTKDILDLLEDDDVLELCCGHAPLALYLKEYEGVDSSLEMLLSAEGRDVALFHCSVMEFRPTRENMTVLMQASLYQFMDVPLIERILSWKPKRIIIAEPYRSLGSSWISKLCTGTSYKFTEESLREWFAKHGFTVVKKNYRELVGVRSCW